MNGTFKIISRQRTYSTMATKSSKKTNNIIYKWQRGKLKTEKEQDKQDHEETTRIGQYLNF